uniref:Dihydrodipicolinate synthase n=1 Tax=uncultured soil bacterium TaxID=164851 RepID=E2D2I2_9BACT|nr:dihydrodipicolinate synthase [uncultured soil bacterium]
MLATADERIQPMYRPPPLVHRRHAKDLASVGAVHRRRQAQQSVGPVLGRDLRTAPCLVRAGAVHSHDDRAGAVHRLDRGTGHRPPLLVRQGRVLAQRAVRADSVTAVAHRPLAVFGVTVVVHCEPGRRPWRGSPSTVIRSGRSRRPAASPGPLSQTWTLPSPCDVVAGGRATPVDDGDAEAGEGEFASAGRTDDPGAQHCHAHPPIGPSFTLSNEMEAKAG